MKCSRRLFFLHISFRIALFFMFFMFCLTFSAFYLFLNILGQMTLLSHIFRKSLELTIGMKLHL